MTRSKSFDGSYWNDDLTCWVTCACGFELEKMVSDSHIEICPECGRGYRVYFEIEQYEPEGLKGSYYVPIQEEVKDE